MTQDTSHSPEHVTADGSGTHHFENADVTVNGTAWYDSKTYKSLVAFIGLVRWLVVAIVFTGGVYIYQRDTNAQSSVNVLDVARETKDLRALMDERMRVRDAQFSDLKNTTVSTVQFRAEFDALNKRLDRIEVALDRMQTIR